MPKRKDNKEERAINILKLLVLMNEQDRDALPGSVVKKVKECVAILKKRRRGREAKKRRPQS
jgi:hypothetical protein